MGVGEGAGVLGRGRGRGLRAGEGKVGGLVCRRCCWAEPEPQASGHWRTHPCTQIAEPQRRMRHCASALPLAAAARAALVVRRCTPVGRPNRGLHAGRSLSRVRRLRLLHLRARPQLRALGAVSQICSATRIAACRIHLRLSCPFQAPCSRRLSVSRGAALPDSPKSHHSALLYASWLPLSSIPTAKVSFRPRSSPIPSDVGGGPAARYVECCSRCCYSFPVHTCNLPPPEPAVFALAIFVA